MKAALFASLALICGLPCAAAAQADATPPLNLALPPDAVKVHELPGITVVGKDRSLRGTIRALPCLGCDAAPPELRKALLLHFAAKTLLPSEPPPPPDNAVDRAYHESVAGLCVPDNPFGCFVTPNMP